MMEKTTTDKPNPDKATTLPAQAVTTKEPDKAKGQPAQTTAASHGFDPVGSAGKKDGQNGRPGSDPKTKDASKDAKK
jgi:hypothetical protein